MTRIEYPVANPLVVLREEFDDWAVLFNPDTAEAVGINPVGVTVWKRMNGTKSIDTIAEEIRDDFEGVPETALGEIAAFVDILAERGFVGYGVKDST